MARIPTRKGIGRSIRPGPLIGRQQGPAVQLRPGHKPKPVGPRPGAPKPATAAPVQPYDPAYQAYVAQQNRDFGISDANAAYNIGQEAYNTGFNQNGTLNESNPYSEAALLKENFNRATSGTLNSYANQGQLYSGAYGRMQGENSRQYSIGYNNAATRAADTYHRIAYGRQTAASQAGVGLNDQARLALYRALFPTG